MVDIAVGVFAAGDPANNQAERLPVDPAARGRGLASNFAEDTHLVVHRELADRIKHLQRFALAELPHDAIIRISTVEDIGLEEFEARRRYVGLLEHQILNEIKNKGHVEAVWQGSHLVAKLHRL